MKTIYRIKPVDKKSIEITYEAYKEIDGSFVNWSVTELYRWGQGFVETIDELPYLESKYVVTDPNVGDGAELDDHISTNFEFDDELTDVARERIEECWMNGDPEDEDNRSNAAWLFDYSDWQIEDNSITIYAPFEVTKLTYDDKYNLVSEEPVELKPRPANKPNKAWPFSK